MFTNDSFNDSLIVITTTEKPFPPYPVTTQKTRHLLKIYSQYITQSILANLNLQKEQKTFYFNPWIPSIQRAENDETIKG